METFKCFRFGRFIHGILLENTDGFALAGWATIKGYKKIDETKLYRLDLKTLMALNEYAYQTKVKVSKKISVLPPRRCILKKYRKSKMVEKNFNKFKQLNCKEIFQ